MVLWNCFEVELIEAGVFAVVHRQSGDPRNASALTISQATAMLSAVFFDREQADEDAKRRNATLGSAYIPRIVSYAGKDGGLI